MGGRVWREIWQSRKYHASNNTVQMVVSSQISRIRLFVDMRYYYCGNMLVRYNCAPKSFARRRSGNEVRYGGAQST